jgi:prevent-host-death family protein
MARTITFTQARSELSSILDELDARHEHVVITRSGRVAAVMLSPAEYEALQETLEILGDEELLTSLRRSEEDLAAGRTNAWEAVKDELGLA